jgi:hypothetical protein
MAFIFAVAAKARRSAAGRKAAFSGPHSWLGDKKSGRRRKFYGIFAPRRGRIPLAARLPARAQACAAHKASSSMRCALPAQAAAPAGWLHKLPENKFTLILRYSPRRPSYTFFI